MTKWHNVRYEPPKHSGEYLVWAPSYGGRMIMSYDVDNRVVRTWYYYYGDEYTEVDKSDIAYWCELPESPANSLPPEDDVFYDWHTNLIENDDAYWGGDIE